jgi:hypothetical protein
MPGNDIFISYSRRDTGDAIDLCELLKKGGHDPWFDIEDIRGGDLWQHQIVEGIKNCELFIVLLSENSIASKYVTREVALAYKKNKKILPITLKGFTPEQIPNELEFPLTGLQCIKNGDIHKKSENFFSLIKTLMPIPPTKKMDTFVGARAVLMPVDGKEVKIKKANNTIGRSREATIDLTHLNTEKYVSKYHADLDYDYVSDKWILTAQKKAKNPTRVNGKVIAPGKSVTLKWGDTIEFATLCFTFLKRFKQKDNSNK